MYKNLIQRDLKKLFFESFKTLGIKSNDHLYLAIDMGALFSNYLNDPKKIETINDNKFFFTRFVLEILKKYISSKGSLICPTFSFSPIKTKFFDVKNTKTDVGIFSQIFLKDKNSLRSDHSIHSLAAIGRFKETLTNGHGMFSFGINSPFDKLLEYKVKFINIGVPFWRSCTYIHHVQHLNGCNFRYYKSFKVKKKINNKIKVSYDYDFLRFRALSKDPINTEKIERVLNKKKFISYVKKPIFFSAVDCVNVYNETKILLKDNPSTFIKGSKKVIFNDNFKNENLLRLKII